MQNWEAVCISPTATVKVAIEVLNKAGSRIVLVVDQEQSLLGTITDGDVRRAILENFSLETAVHYVMNSNPIKGQSDWSSAHLFSLFEKHNLVQLPIVNDHNQVVGLHSLHEFLAKRRHDNPVLLLAGGFGKRLFPLTQDCPKPLLKLNHKPILEFIIERLVEAGFHRFYISTHYKHESIADYFSDGSQWRVNIQYLYEKSPLGTGGALGLLPHSEVDLPILVMNGDLLTNLDFHNLLSFHQDHQGVATLCVREYEHVVPFGVVEACQHQVLTMVEKPRYQFFVNAGIYIVSPEVAQSIMPNVCIDMPDVIQHHIQKNKPVYMFPIHEYWLDIGRIDDYKKAQVDVRMFT